MIVSKVVLLFLLHENVVYLAWYSILVVLRLNTGL